MSYKHRKKPMPTRSKLLLLFAGYGIYSFIANVVKVIIWLTS
jgi:hypothetical protein